MKHAFSRLVAGMLTLALLFSLSPFALADEGLTGVFVDEIIPMIDELLEQTYAEAFDGQELDISKDLFTVESGVIYFDFDKLQIRIAGARNYRTYNLADENYFSIAVMMLCGTMDAVGWPDFGIRLYSVSDGQTQALTQEQVSIISAELTKMLGGKE